MSEPQVCNQHMQADCVVGPNAKPTPALETQGVGCVRISERNFTADTGTNTGIEKGND
jgi:hypothetical protein